MGVNEARFAGMGEDEAKDEKRERKGLVLQKMIMGDPLFSRKVIMGGVLGGLVL